jgi:hypothetical protein
VTEDDAAKRARDITEGVDAECRERATVGSDAGKKSGPKTSAAALALTKKSYHSMTVPMALAATTLAVDAR